jgi:signal transduction histidine kinase
MALVVLLIGTGGSVLLIDESASRSQARHLQWMAEGPLATLASAGAMSEAYSQDLVGSSCRALRGQIGARQAAAQAESAMARIALHWRALLEAPVDASQQALLAQLDEARAAADRVAAGALQALQTEDLSRLQPLCESELAAAFDPVILRLRLLSELAVASADAKLDEDRALMQRARAWRLGLSLFTLAVVAAVGWRLSRNLVRGIEGLEDIALRLRERDFRDVDVFRPSGELGAVVDAFEDMRRELLRYGTELRRSELRANAANRAKSAFLADHEPRAAHADDRRHRHGRGAVAHPPGRRPAARAGVIRQSADNLLQIIGDILDFSKIEAGKLELAPTTRPARLVEGCVLNFVAAASSKGLSLDCRSTRRCGGLLADALRLRQILGNFLSNAIKFTEHGGVHVSLERVGRRRVRRRAFDCRSATPASASPRPRRSCSSPSPRPRPAPPGASAAAAWGWRSAPPGRTDGRPHRPGEPCRRGHHACASNWPCRCRPRPGRRDRACSPCGSEPRHADACPAWLRPKPSSSLVLLVDDHPTNRLVVTRQLALAGFRCETANDGEQGLQAWRSGASRWCCPTCTCR